TQSQLQKYKIDVVSAPITQIIANAEESLAGFQLDSLQNIEADIGFVCLGIRPNNGLALALNAKVDERGLVVTDQQGESSIPNMFVIGDLRAGSMKQIYTAWQHAVDAVQVIDRRIRAEQ
ncbi:MAG: FAD-dependent oxidoreductase, partial [Verrucomicrobia bacterium]|nr:FAD-dependent oxidoreductase [Verrucomicrobiota bacterium]